MPKIEKVEAQVLDHLGIVSSIIDHLGIVEKIDKILSEKNQKYYLTHGQIVKAFLLIGLGFQKRRLYLIKDFFKCRPVDLLFGKGVKAEHFSEFACGRTLEAIYEYGLQNFYYRLMVLINNERDIINNYFKVDTTSLSVQGRYIKGKKGEGAFAKGHSKQKRPDLLQLVLSIGMSGAAKLPVFMGVHSGNENDKEILPKITQKIELIQDNVKWNDDVIKVSDSAIYSEKFVSNNPFDNIWVTRIPESSREAKKFVEK